MDFSALALDDLRTPLTVMLAHMQLLAVKRLSSSGRQRLEVLEIQIRLLMQLLDRCGAARQPVRRLAPIDLSVTIEDVLSEFDAVLQEEASRPY